MSKMIAPVVIKNVMAKGIQIRSMTGACFAGAFPRPFVLSVFLEMERNAY